MVSFKPLRCMFSSAHLLRSSESSQDLEQHFTCSTSSKQCIRSFSLHTQVAGSSCVTPRRGTPSRRESARSSGGPGRRCQPSSWSQRWSLDSPNPNRCTAPCPSPSRPTAGHRLRLCPRRPSKVTALHWASRFAPDLPEASHPGPRLEWTLRSGCRMFNFTSNRSNIPSKLPLLCSRSICCSNVLVENSDGRWTCEGKI